ncbi:type I secretion C-terminal target domain-containing protein, partial [Pseudomaricurvus sp.]|uniref:type I secretion C-terminal target domain-containing protein n=1 Tax=Pseudomaricurvus sp. TaxID=2004510 RepID=UPI003F6AF2B0
YAQGVNNLSLVFGSRDSAFWDVDGILFTVIDINNNVLAEDVAFEGTTLNLSGYSNVARVEIYGAQSESFEFWGDTYRNYTDVSIQTLNFESAIIDVPDPELVDYTLTDSDGQSDSAQLSIYAIDNTINGTANADSIVGSAANDAISGGAGDDVLRGAAGHDTLAGGEGDDELYGNAGLDNLSGGAGNDSLFGGADNDTLAGGAGDDLLDGGTGDDIVKGDDGNDLVFGGAGNDRLEGGKGADTLYGGAGNDTILGGEDADIIFGGTGNDTLTGGQNIDTFVWQVADVGAVDVITDFEVDVNGDVLNFADLLQGEDDTAETLDDYLSFTNDGTNTTISIDVDGDGSGTDQQVILQDVVITGDDQTIIQQLLDDGNLHVD